MRVAKVKEKIAKDLMHLARPIASLTIDPKNVNVHERASIEGIKFSLREYGQQKAIVYDPKTRIITAGNGTVLAARELGWRRIAASAFDGPAEKVRKFGIADNATQRLSHFDQELLRVEVKAFDLAELQVLGLGSLSHALMDPDDPKEGAFRPATQEEQGKLDIVVQITCPNCGYQFRRR